MNPIGLPLWDRPLPEEPAHGLAMRLAEVNGLPTLGMVWDHTGLSQGRLRRGEQLDELAKTVRCGVDEVARDSFVLDLDGVTVRVRGVPLNFVHDYDLKRRRVCPACLRESPHHRFFWDIAFLSTCPRHGLELERRCNCGSDRALGWRDSRVWRGRCCWRAPKGEAGDLREVPGLQGDPEIVAMDAYFGGRLGVVPARVVPALDKFTLHQLQEILDRVGTLQHTGWSKTWKKATDVPDLSVEAVRATGFRLMAEGRVEDALEASYRGFKAGNPNIEPGLTTAYGWFYAWYRIRGGQHFSTEIAEALYHHAASRFRLDRRALRDATFEISDHTSRLRDKFDEQHMTLREAATECGQHLNKVRRIAVDYGLMRSDKLRARRVLLKTADVAVIKDLLARMVDKRCVRELLGINYHMLKRLDDGGMLTPVLKPDDSRNRHGYLVDDFTDILAAFEEQKAGKIDKIGKDEVTLLARGPSRDKLCAWISAVQAGRLRPIEIVGYGVGLQRYCFRRADIEALDVDLAVAPPRNVDFDHWHRRLDELRKRCGGVLPPPPKMAGRGWNGFERARMTPSMVRLAARKRQAM